MADKSPASAAKERGPPDLVLLPIRGERTPGLQDIGTRLIERQRQPTKQLPDQSRLFTLQSRRLMQISRRSNERGAAQQEEHPLAFWHEIHHLCLRKGFEMLYPRCKQ